MLTIEGQQRLLCDRIPRRDFLAIGSLALGGISLPQILRAERQAPVSQAHKSIIMIYLTGGPPHQDLVDLKPNAPSDVRGEFQPISTNVSGIEISEHMPRVAAMMDKFSTVGYGVAALVLPSNRTNLRKY